MGNTLIPIDNNSISKYGSDGDFAAVSSTFQFLPRLQLFGSNSDFVKRGRIPMAHYGLVTQKETVEDMGPEVDMVPVSWRPKAMRITNDQPLSYYNPQSEDFQKVQKDSEQPNSGCMFGPEFLVWLPVLKKFASFFMSSKTARNRAQEVRALMGCGATLGVQLIETAKYTWHGPTIRPCSAEFDNLPDADELKKQVDTFNNPSESTIEFDTSELEKDSTPARPR